MRSSRQNSFEDSIRAADRSGPTVGTSAARSASATPAGERGLGSDHRDVDPLRPGELDDAPRVRGVDPHGRPRDPFEARIGVGARDDHLGLGALERGGNRVLPGTAPDDEESHGWRPGKRLGLYGRRGRPSEEPNPASRHA